jgi:hypothetical protein
MESFPPVEMINPRTRLIPNTFLPHIEVRPGVPVDCLIPNRRRYPAIAHLRLILNFCMHYGISRWSICPGFLVRSLAR